MSKTDTQSLSKYLKERGIQFHQPQVNLFGDSEDAGERLKNAAQAWDTNEAGIRAVIEHRMSDIRKELLLSALPEEVIVLRQSLADLASLFDDFSKASEENKKRAKRQQENAESEPETEVTELPTDEDKSSL